MFVIYTVKSKSVLQDIKDVLEARQFQHVLKDEHTLEIEVPKEKEEDYFLILSFVISFNAFKKYVRSELIRLNVQNDLADQFFHNAIHYFQSSKYWIGLTKVWISDFLSERTHLNADSFATFNMKGFKKEVKDYVSTLIESQEEMYPQDDSFIEPQQIKMEELFSIMKGRVIESGLILSDFKEFHIFENGDTFVVEDRVGNVLDEEFFVTRIGMMVQIGVSGDDGNEAVKDAMTLMCLCHIFEPETVIIHQGLSENAETALKQNESIMTKHTSKSISFEWCEGCEICDENGK